MKGYDRRFGRHDEEKVSPINDHALKNMLIALLLLALILALI